MNSISRRLFLRNAGVAGAVTTLSVPALAADTGDITSMESTELLQLGIELEQKVAAFKEAKARQNAA